MKKLFVLTMIVAMLAVFVPVAFAAPPAQGQDYIIAKGDWLSKVSEKYLKDPMKYAAIAIATNNKHAKDPSYAFITNVDLIEPGWKLYVPSEEEAKALLETKTKVAVITKDIAANNPFWATVWKGAEETAKIWQVELTLDAPTSEADVAIQIAKVEDAITKGNKALVVAPTDASALNPAFDKAKAAGIPVLIIDSDTTWPGKLTFIGTDNKAGGKLAGEYLCTQVSKGDKVAIITGHMTAQSIADRVNGAKEAFAACGVTVVAELNGQHTVEGGRSVMEDVITSNPDVKAVFCANDNMALGAVAALKAANKLAGVKVCGFDANPDAAASILAGELSATIAQSPYNMGRYGLIYGLGALAGFSVPPRIDTGTTLVTKDNAEAYK